VLNLIKEIHSKIAYMNTGSIVVYSDMKTIITEVRKEIVKESQCVREAGVSITEIRKEIEQAKISISLEYSSTKTRYGEDFEDNPGPYLMRECYKQSKMMRREMEDKEHKYITHVADTTPIYKNVISNKLISVLIWETDAKENEKLYAKSKYPEYLSWLDIEVRNVFHEGVGAGTLKCVVGFNHYGIRDKAINRGLTDDKCLQCQCRET